MSSAVAALRPPAGTATYAASRLLPGVSGLLMVVLVLRLVGATTYGTYTVALAVAYFAGNLTTGWYRQAALRFAGDRTLDADALPAWSTRGALLTSAAVSAGLLRLLDEHAGSGLLLATAVVTAVTAHQSMIVTLLQCRIEPRRVLLAEGLRAVLQLLLPCLALLLLAPRPEVLLLSVGAGVAVSVLPFRAGRPADSSGPERTHGLQVLYSWWGYGWPLSLWLSVATVHQLADRVLIARWVGDGAAGTYAAVYDVLNGGLAMCLFPVTMAAQPLISRLWNEGRAAEAMAANARAMQTQIVVFLLVLVLVLPLRGRLVALVLPGGGKGQVGLVLPILLGAFAWQLSLSVHKRLELERRSRTMLLFLLLATAVNLAANAALLRPYGAVAAAWTTCASAGLYLGLCVAWRLRRRRSGGAFPCLTS